jgi:hypothetical protein
MNSMNWNFVVYNNLILVCVSVCVCVWWWCGAVFSSLDSLSFWLFQQQGNPCFVWPIH